MTSPRSRSLGHVAIIDANPRSASRKLERKAAERVKGRLKDEFGGRQVPLRGHAKVLCHLMFGIVALTVSQLLRLLN